MKCLLCGHDKARKHGKTTKGIQRYKCPHCRQTFPANLNSLYYNRHLSPDEVHTILQSHAEGSSLRGVSRISGRAYGTVVSLVRDASQKSQMIHNAEVEQVKTEEIMGDEMWSFVFKNKKTAPQKI
jgi:transposase-like protein